VGFVDESCDSAGGFWCAAVVFTGEEVGEFVVVGVKHVEIVTLPVREVSLTSIRCIELLLTCQKRRT
jgi:hypothetical protein